MAKVDFITLANIIFKDKDKYKFVSDEEKEATFFMLNRKYAIKFLKQAQFFNNKNVNRASAMDIWYQVFYKTTNGTPQWWWKSKVEAKPKSEFTVADIKLIKSYYNITDSDIKFLIKFESEKLKEDIKRLKKFNK
jgi:hypothetical protein